MKRTLRYNIVDVFTQRPLSGNPLAVFTNAPALSTEKMQAIAREMNLSETVFFQPPQQGGHVKLRIFTPRNELPFAGHPIIGSAWVLGQPMEMEVLRLETAMGIIAVRLQRSGSELQLATMTQPVPSFEPYSLETELVAALGVAEEREGLLPTVVAKNGPCHLLFEVASEEELDNIEPDLSALAKLAEARVLAFAQEGNTCFARYFAPSFGISEDPATGSACGPMGAHLMMQGRVESGSELIVHQGRKMQRPSQLFVRAWREGEVLSQVEVAGAAVVVARGEFTADD